MDEEEALSLVTSIEGFDRRLVCSMDTIAGEFEAVNVYAGEGQIARLHYPEDWSAFLENNPSMDRFFDPS